MPSANTTTVREDADRTRVGATIRELRQARGYTPQGLACELKISRSYLANIEAGRKRLTPVLLPLIAAALNVRQISIVPAGYFGDAE